MLEPIQGKCARTYSIASHKPHELRLLESHKVLRTHSQELGVEVELWHHHPSMVENLLFSKERFKGPCKCYKHNIYGIIIKIKPQKECDKSQVSVSTDGRIPNLFLCLFSFVKVKQYYTTEVCTKRYPVKRGIH